MSGMETTSPINCEKSYREDFDGQVLGLFDSLPMIDGLTDFPPTSNSFFLLPQAVILENEELPKLFLDFLNVRHLPSLPKAESCGSFDQTESEESSKLSHQPMPLFLGDPYVLPAASDFPNVVIEGVLHGIFFSHLQPR